MDSDIASALEVIKNSGVLQANKIKSLENQIETLSTRLIELEATNRNLRKQKSDEIRMLTLKLQVKTDIIEATNKNIENFQATHAFLQKQVLNDIIRRIRKQLNITAFFSFYNKPRKSPKLSATWFGNSKSF
jgi:hypothetical protein